VENVVAGSCRSRPLTGEIKCGQLSTLQRLLFLRALNSDQFARYDL
jgi:hypothetical protein